MMQRDPLGEKVVCFLCDYGLLVLAVLIVGVFALWWLLGRAPAAPPPSPVIPLTTTPENTALPTENSAPPSIATATIALPTESNVPPSIPTSTIEPLSDPTPSPTPDNKPEFVLVFIPVNWSSGQASFETVANSHARQFIEDSDIGSYFSVRIEILNLGLEDVSLSDPNLDLSVYEFGLTNTPGDRYIGITDGDLVQDGDTSIAGWTSGGQAMIVEAEGVSITAHELGHTFGLCDEYNYSEWVLQNESFMGGCPNPYPASCPMITSDEITCDGQPTSDGRNSIMGPAGLFGEYGFNDACLEHLQQTFEYLTSLRTP